ncbi:MAG: pseudaminic acid cytidylyltransferase [Gammaproteobacteria bacterium]|nr:pseudaminic acid cytidylyltransferase [Gammaproteobacteria bacterium]MBU1624021.1 pseudaminic acid cytidylyltransferase [Gammaproteobacteria bacterium]MBU1981749.1 pseudaminic acid cytidylyltransferase [Gammaproteobacteria bacterium]
MKIAVIPARGGSKRIPRKNIKEFFGKPMIAWSLEAARSSGVFDRIIVSTDDAEIAEVAKAWGAEVPFSRPDALSNDYAGTTEVIAHATQWMLSQGVSVDAVCCIYATAPFIRGEDIRLGLDALQSGDWAYAFTVTDFAAPIFRSFRQTEKGGLEMFFPEHFATRSQDLPTALHDAGQFYWGRPSAWIEGLRIFGHQSTPLFIPRWRVQDIDTQEDWVRAEILAPGIVGQGEKHA